MDLKMVLGPVGIKKEIKNLLANIKGKAHGHGQGSILMEKKYEGKYELEQTGSWTYYNKNGKKNLEELYYVCTDECKDAILQIEKDPYIYVKN